MQAAVSPSVASPLTTAAWAPYITVLKGVKTLLSTLADSFNGPLGVVGGAVDVVSGPTGRDGPCTCNSLSCWQHVECAAGAGTHSSSGAVTAEEEDCCMSVCKLRAESDWVCVVVCVCVLVCMQATNAANDVLGFATGGAVNVSGLSSLVQTALNLLGRIPGL